MTTLEMEHILWKESKNFSLGSRNTYHSLLSGFCRKIEAYCRTQRINVDDGYA